MHLCAVCGHEQGVLADIRAHIDKHRSWGSDCLQGIAQEKQQRLFESAVKINIEVDVVVQVTPVPDAEKILYEIDIDRDATLCQAFVAMALECPGNPAPVP